MHPSRNWTPCSIASSSEPDASPRLQGKLTLTMSANQAVRDDLLQFMDKLARAA